MSVQNENGMFPQMLQLWNGSLFSSDCYFKFHGACHSPGCRCDCHKISKNIPIGYNAYPHFARSHHSFSLYEHEMAQHLQIKMKPLEKEQSELLEKRSHINEEIKRLTANLQYQKDKINERLFAINSQISEITQEAKRYPDLRKCKQCGHDQEEHTGNTGDKATHCKICSGDSRSPCGVWTQKEFERYRRNIDRWLEEDRKKLVRLGLGNMIPKMIDTKPNHI